ncbi:hypothetical protein ACP70R_027818 [Stipagrostis hirtigluma subsp. patula]
MHSCEHDHATTLTAAYQPCTAGRSLQLPAHQPGHQALPAAVAPAAVQPRRSKKKHGARPSSSSRRSSTTVVATDVANFRAMVQELTGFPAAAIFRPLPRRVHAAGPFAVAGGQAGRGGEGRARGSETMSITGCGISSPDAPAVQPVMQQSALCAPPGVFDGLSDLGSPEFDSWGDLSIE